MNPFFSEESICSRPSSEVAELGEEVGLRVSNPELLTSVCHSALHYSFLELPFCLVTGDTKFHFGDKRNIYSYK